MKLLLAITALTALALLGAMAFIRLAPIHPDDWHLRPDWVVPDSAGWRDWVLYPPGDTGGPVAMPGGAYALKTLHGTTAVEALRALDRIALATPRTSRLAGRPEDGMITWVTRSAFWGFPDITTAEAIPRGLPVDMTLVARQRFGRGDGGVNAVRLLDWLSRF